MAFYAKSMVAESWQLYCGLVQQRLHDSPVIRIFLHSFTQQLIAPWLTEASAGQEAEPNCVPWLPHLLQVLRAKLCDVAATSAAGAQGVDRSHAGAPGSHPRPGGARSHAGNFIFPRTDGAILF